MCEIQNITFYESLIISVLSLMNLIMLKIGFPKGYKTKIYNLLNKDRGLFIFVVAINILMCIPIPIVNISLFTICFIFALFAIIILIMVKITTCVFNFVFKDCLDKDNEFPKKSQSIDLSYIYKLHDVNGKTKYTKEIYDGKEK